jgi:hypothetical protein
MVEVKKPVPQEGHRPAGTFGLPQAVALIMGSIIGVGIFNLPYSLASIGPISLVAMVLTTIGAVALALMFAALSRRLPADGVLPVRLDGAEGGGGVPVLRGDRGHGGDRGADRRTGHPARQGRYHRHPRR